MIKNILVGRSANGVIKSRIAWLSLVLVEVDFEVKNGSVFSITSQVCRTIWSCAGISYGAGLGVCELVGVSVFGGLW
jgi:hypothetical protein